MKKSAPDKPSVNLRRAYFECRNGQLHVRTAFPSTGGFDELTTLVCLHDSPRSSRAYAAFLPEIGTDRSVYACDTPGCGESDPPPAPPVMADYAGAIGDFLDALRLREVDVVGTGTGAAIAVELAIARPQAVRRLVLAGVPLANQAEREAYRREPWPLAAAADGSHLLAEWRRLTDAGGPGAPLEQLTAGLADQLRAGRHAPWGVAATVAWQGAERLPLVAQKTLVLRPRDAHAEATLRARPLLRNAVWDELPDVAGGLFGAAAVATAARVRAFLDR